MYFTKDNMRIFLILFTALFVMAAPYSAIGEELTYADVINKAGRQRMLTQRITRIYCQIGLDIKTDMSRQQLQDSINLFSSQLRMLENFSKEEDIVEALKTIQSLWVPFKELATSNPVQANVKEMAIMDEKLLMASEHLVNLLVTHSGNAVTRLVNISGRQRMLSQRLAKFYLLKSWDHRSPTLNSEIERAKNEFSGALDALMQAPENTYSIKEKLEKSKLQWAWFNSSLSLSQDEYFPLIVVDASEKLLNIMEKITGMYQRIAINEARFSKTRFDITNHQYSLITSH